MATYITTPIYYVNAQPHLGHAYTTIVADTYGRFRKLCDDEVRFQTGTDEHGDKIVLAATRENVAPREYVDSIAALFRKTWPLLHVEYDRFIRTTDSDHVETVRHILQKVYDQGDIYFDEYSGLYCTGCERFLTERELDGGKCPDHQVAPDKICEQNYFFRMSKYQQRLIEHIEQHPEFITPAPYRNEVLSFLSEPLEDLCISRPTSRLTWGIGLPFDDGYVTYVWFDALINYLSGLGYPDQEDFARFWPSAEHLIAKDILKPHAVYWPTMLLAAGIPLFRKLHVHGYWNIDETKMSKSIGNVVGPAELVEEYGVDTLRYFVLREMSFGRDASFSREAIITRANADLANDLGNLYSRSVSMIEKYCGGVIPESGSLEPVDVELRNVASSMADLFCNHMNDFQFHLGLKALWDFVGTANRYIVKNAPWELAKAGDRRDRLQTVLYHLAESLRLLSLLLKPIMPETAARMQHGLGLDEDSPLMRTLAQGATWGRLEAGTTLRRIDNLFPRIVSDKKHTAALDGKTAVTKEKKQRPDQPDNLITFEQFKEVELRVARVIEAERVEKSTRLLKLTVLAPERRTIVAGIAEDYRPEDVHGMNVVIVANLKPARLMGITSQGMILAARSVDDAGRDRFTPVTVQKDVAPGAKVA